MTLKKIVEEYDKYRNNSYHKDDDNYYRDCLKKLKQAFECIGLTDMSLIKDPNSRSYNILEKDKEYIFYLLDSETSKFFKNIKNGDMTNEDYIQSAKEADKLFEFLKSYVPEEQYNSIITEISSRIDYPLTKRYLETEYEYNNFVSYYNSLIRNEGILTNIPYWEYLENTDKALLYDELIKATKNWVSLVNAVGEYRHDEIIDSIDNINTDEIQIYCIVEQEIEQECIKAYEKLPPEPIRKDSRSFKSYKTEYEKYDSDVANIKEKIAKNYCRKHNIDYRIYLKEKAIVDGWNCSKLSSKELLAKLKKNL